MRRTSSRFGRLAPIVLLLALSAFSAVAAEIHVACSGGFAAAYRRLAPEFEKVSGHTLVNTWGPSTGETEYAIPKRLQRKEVIDVVIMVGADLDRLVRKRLLIPESKRVLAYSRIGVAVRAGAEKPDITSVAALKAALLKARSIAYSDSASGIYVSGTLFPRLGIADQVRDKARMIPAEPVGQVVARGEAEIGFQQVSELLPVSGIELIGVLPQEVAAVTLFSAGIAADAHEKAAAQALINFLSSPQAVEVIRATGLEAAN